MKRKGNGSGTHPDPCLGPVVVLLVVSMEFERQKSREEPTGGAFGQEGFLLALFLFRSISCVHQWAFLSGDNSGGLECFPCERQRVIGHTVIAALSPLCPPVRSSGTDRLQRPGTSQELTRLWTGLSPAAQCHRHGLGPSLASSLPPAWPSSARQSLLSLLKATAGPCHSGTLKCWCLLSQSLGIDPHGPGWRTAGRTLEQFLQRSFVASGC